MDLPTVARLAGKAFRYPSRAVRNGIHVAKFAMLDLVAERAKFVRFLGNQFDVDIRSMQQELKQSEFFDWTRSRRLALAAFDGPYRFGSTGEWDCRSLYYLVRALKPRVVVETGVCYGASSSYILEALNRNGAGELYSIDLGNTPQEPSNEFFVHPAHRNRWHLIIGDSRVELPRLLKRLGHIDHFHHDSLHTYEHMMWEYETAFSHLNAGGAITSDDVSIILKLSQPFRRSPFAEFCDRHGLAYHTVRNFGVAVERVPALSELGRWSRG